MQRKVIPTTVIIEFLQNAYKDYFKDKYEIYFTFINESCYL